MNTCVRFYVAVLWSLLLLAGSAVAQEGGEANAGAAKDAQPASSDEAAIRASAARFSADFNKGDAKAVAAHWTEDGEFINDAGKRFEGRAAIQAEHEAFFKQNAGVKLQLVVDSVRIVSTDTVIEDGRVVLEAQVAGPPAISKYVAIHVRKNGKWMLASVRDSRIELPSNYKRLSDLEWFIGDWRSEHLGVQVDVTCRWIANKNFVERTHQIMEKGQVTASGRDIIGWDPGEQAIKIWKFSSDGGLATGVCSRTEQGWVVRLAGYTREGAQTTATNVLSRVSDQALSWKSTNRSVDGVAFPDAEELLLKRR